MTIERLDISRLLAADMRDLMDEESMAHVLRRCGGVIMGDGEEWYAKIASVLIRGADRGRVLSQALDIIAIRTDLWPGPPSAA